MQIFQHIAFLQTRDWNHCLDAFDETAASLGLLESYPGTQALSLGVLLLKRTRR
ncbi:MAG: hypothetical protein ACFCD0_14920 [Gemmataceae bacterium]